MSLQSHGRTEQVVSVTTAQLSHSADIALRERRYVLMQLGRLACIVLGIALPVPMPVRLLLFAGAIVLPWFGVVMANAGPTVSKPTKSAIIERGSGSLPEQPLRIAIEPGRVIDAER